MKQDNLNLNVQLIETKITDKEKIFNWLANSNLTSEMLGPPIFPDNPVPSWKEFDEDYLDYFFDGSEKFNGRCFIILFENEEVGQINYNPIDQENKTTELDIWLKDKKFTGKGIGTKAIQILCSFLFEKMDCKKIIIQPSARNTNAIKSYKKAGFKILKQIPKDFELDYFDGVLLELNKFSSYSINSSELYGSTSSPTEF